MSTGTMITTKDFDAMLGMTNGASAKAVRNHADKYQEPVTMVVGENRRRLIDENEAVAFAYWYNNVYRGSRTPR